MNAGRILTAGVSVHSQKLTLFGRLYIKDVECFKADIYCSQPCILLKRFSIYNGKGLKALVFSKHENIQKFSLLNAGTPQYWSQSEMNDICEVCSCRKLTFKTIWPEQTFSNSTLRTWFERCVFSTYPWCQKVGSWWNCKWIVLVTFGNIKA